MRIGVDLGGTNVRVGLVAGGRIVRMISEPCRADGSEAEVLDHIASLVDRLITPDVECIGIGVPSVVDAERGIVYDVVGIPSWREVHLKERFEKRFGVPVSVNNDCNCFALGVCRFGEAHGYRDVVCIALGTGVGAGVVIGGKLYCGRNTGAGEIGGRGTSGKEAYERALAGDSRALELWQEFGTHIGQLVMLALYAYDPQAIVFGGSISHAFGFFRDAMYEQLKQFPYAKTVERLHICCSGIEYVGLLGASACE